MIEIINFYEVEKPLRGQADIAQCFDSIIGHDKSKQKFISDIK